MTYFIHLIRIACSPVLAYLGLVREVGRRLFNCTVTCKVLHITEDIASVIAGVDGDSFKEYVKFELHIVKNISLPDDTVCGTSSDTPLPTEQSASFQGIFHHQKNVLLRYTYFIICCLYL